VRAKLGKLELITGTSQIKSLVIKDGTLAINGKPLVWPCRIERWKEQFGSGKSALGCQLSVRQRWNASKWIRRFRNPIRCLLDKHELAGTKVEDNFPLGSYAGELSIDGVNYDPQKRPSVSEWSDLGLGLAWNFSRENFRDLSWRNLGASQANFSGFHFGSTFRLTQWRGYPAMGCGRRQTTTTEKHRSGKRRKTPGREVQWLRHCRTNSLNARTAAGNHQRRP